MEKSSAVESSHFEGSPAERELDHRIPVRCHKFYPEYRNCSRGKSSPSRCRYSGLCGSDGHPRKTFLALFGKNKIDRRRTRGCNRGSEKGRGIQPCIHGIFAYGKAVGTSAPDRQ